MSFLLERKCFNGGILKVSLGGCRDVDSLYFQIYEALFKEIKVHLMNPDMVSEFGSFGLKKNVTKFKHFLIDFFQQKKGTPEYMISKKHFDDNNTRRFCMFMDNLGDIAEHDLAGLLEFLDLMNDKCKNLKIVINIRKPI